MDFSRIKAIAQYALSAEMLSQDELEVVKTAVLSDSNQQRADLLMEVLSLNTVRPTAQK
jgi:hypothetical protein